MSNSEIILQKPKFSLRTKLGLSLTILLGTISLLIYIYVPHVLKRQSMEALMDKGRSIAEMTAYSSSAAIYFNDMEDLRETFESAELIQDINFIVFHDSLDGSVSFSDVDLTGHEKCFSMSKYEFKEINEDNVMIDFPVIFRGSKIGSICVGLSTVRINRLVERSQLNIALLSLGIFITGMLTIIIISTLVTKPLHNIVTTVEQISKGEYHERAPVTSHDEVGFLATSFNRMVDNLESARNELTEVNLNLENAILKRTSELIREIEERKRTEKALFESEQKFRNIVQSSPMGMHMYHLEDGDRLVFIGSNPAADRILGIDHEQFIGKIIEEAFPSLVSTEIPARYRDVALTGRVWKTEQIDYADGSIKGAFDVYAFQTSQDKMVALFHDVTDRKLAVEALKESEDKFRTIASSAQHGIIMMSEKGLVSYWNDAASTIFGYSEEEIIGRTLHKVLIPERLHEAYRTAFRNFKETGEGDQIDKIVEMIAINKEGKEFPVELSLSKIYIKGQINAVGIVSDISDRKLLEEQFRQSQKMDAIGRLAGGVAHDFNNLLTVIAGNTELAQLAIESGNSLNEEIDEIQNATDRAASLTRQLLAFSRKQTLEPRIANLNSVISDLNRMLRRISGETIVLKNVYGDNLWNVKVDPGQIEQVIVNLAVNSRDAMPMGGSLIIETANVELDSEYSMIQSVDAEGPHVLISVSDNGEGMEAEVKSKIFEPFFTTKSAGKGTGLGLSTVYGIVRQSDGLIWVYSEPEVGTTFKIYFPATFEKVDIISSTVAEESPSGNGEEILVVEDEKKVRIMTVKALQRLGYKVDHAVDGKNAYMKCDKRKTPYDMIITDVVMPRMNGIELIKAVRDFWHDIKYMYISGYTPEDISEGKITPKTRQFLQKPFNSETLARKIREVLDM